MRSLGAAPCALSEPIVPEYQRRMTPPTFHLEVDLWGPPLSSDSGACGGEPGPPPDQTNGPRGRGRIGSTAGGACCPESEPVRAPDRPTVHQGTNMFVTKEFLHSAPSFPSPRRSLA